MDPNEPGAVTTIDPDTDEPDTPSCAVCPHPWAEHDALGRRFCSATHDVGWSRGCICR